MTKTRWLSVVVAIVLLSGCPGPQAPVETASDETGAVDEPGSASTPPPVPAPSKGAEDSPRIGEREDDPGVYTPPDPWGYGAPPPWIGATPPPPPPLPGPPPVVIAYPTTGLGPAPPSTGMTVKWKKKIGYTTYRSTIHYFESKIVVNSNGKAYKSDSDSLDALWVLDPKDGSEIEKIVVPGKGEKDVNGVAVTKDTLVFGTDQGTLYKVDWSGKVQWKASVSGDVEAAPALADLDGDTVLDVAAGGEEGVFYAVSGKTGKVLHTTQATQGYYGATGFVGAPALHDATGDGIVDIYVPCRDELFRVIDGKSGASVWTKQAGSGMHGAPVIVDADGDGAEEVVFTEAYSDVYCADAKSGLIEWHVTLENPDAGIEGLFGPVGWYPEAGCVLVGTAWWASSEGVYCLDGKSGTTLWRYHESKKNITSGFVIGDIDGTPGAEAVFGTESGKVVVLDSSGVPVRQIELGGPIECTPSLADVDGDGLIEILVASNDKFLYVIETDGKAPPVIGYHRGAPTNDGVL